MTDSRHMGLAAYAGPRFAPEPELWQRRRAFGESLRPGLQMSAYEGAIVAWLLKLHGAGQVLEIGSFIGLSSLWLASALAPEGKVTTIERDGAYAAYARETIGEAGEGRVEIIHADALHYLRSTGMYYDALFIDGEKKAYPDMLEAALPRLKEGALIIADNTLLFGAMLGAEPRTKVAPATREAMERFHAVLADRSRFDSIILPTVEGLTVARYRP